MNEDTMHDEVAAIVDTLMSVPYEIGLEDVWQSIKDDLSITDEHKVKRLTLEAVREMLRRGAQADFDCGIPAGGHNPETTPDEIVARIEREWAKLKALPTIGDICTFVWTPAAVEAYRK